MIRWALWRAIRIGESMGFHLPGSLDQYLRRLLQRANIGTVFDVGANRGDYGAHLRRLGYRGRIISFEPVSSTYAELTHRARHDPLWTTHQYALGKSEEVREIHIPPLDNLASLLKPSTFSLAQFGTAAQVARTERVTVRRLDAVFSACVNGRGGGVLLKVDAQGTDLDVVEGALDVLPKIAAIQLEVNVTPLYDGASSLPDSARRLGELGYDLGALFPVLFAKPDDLRLVDADCFFVRRPS
jgi:FkbM family methyltransferase